MTVSIKEVAKITQVVQYSEVQIDKSGAILLSIQEELQTTLQKYQQQLTQLRSVVQASIEQHEPEYFSASTDNYQQGMRADTPAQVLGRTRTLGADTEKLLCNRLAAYTSWQYPGMVLRPAHCPGLENLVALDPLYLVDTHQDLLDPIRSLFTPNYQRRLRYYVIEEYTSNKIFWNLPSGQFGLVCAFRYFEFKPWEVLQQYLNEIFELLRPGGTFLFSFNDCDHWRSVGLAEHYFCCYTPGRLIREHVKKLGFEITYDYNDHKGTAWLEIKKNGQLDSIRGSQVVAVIYRKADPVPEVVDKSVKELYNELDLDMLIELARVLNVDISQDKTKHDFNIKKVRRTISTYIESKNYSEAYLRQLFKIKENP
jgi:SAM-dependent methyltransferase